MQPAVILNKNDISLAEPVLDQLLYGDFRQLQAPAYQKQLFQVTQLLQLACQYFALAQDYYAQQAEDLQTKCDTLISQNATQAKQLQQKIHELDAKKQLPEPAPALVQQAQLLKSQNDTLLRENQQMKLQLKACVPLLAQLPRCQYCEKQFIDKSALASHVQRRHPQVFDLWAQDHWNADPHCPQCAQL